MIGICLLVSIALGQTKLTAQAPPQPEIVGVGSFLTYQVRRGPRPAAPSETHSDGSLTLHARGKTIHLKPAGGYYFVDGAEMAPDGSLLITRRTSTDMWTTHQFIRFRGKESIVQVRDFDTGVMKYFDRHNYVGEFMKETGPAQYPKSPSIAFSVENGRTHVFGYGSPTKVWSVSEMLVEIDVDEDDSVTSLEFKRDEFLRLYKGGRQFEIGKYDFIGSSADHTILLQRGELAYAWRNGKFLHAWRLPEHWKPLAINARGEVLVRNFHAGANWDETGEENWTPGILRGRTIYPLRFKRPKGTEKLLWRETYGFSDSGLVRFHAFYGEDERTYFLVPALSSTGR